MSTIEAQCDEALRLLGQGQISTAHARAIALTRDYPQVAVTWQVLGAVTMHRGSFGDSVAAFRKVVEIEPKNAAAANNLGMALEATGLFKEAESYLRLAIGLDAKCAEAHNNLGNVLQQTGEIQGAISSYEMALEISPKLHSAANNLGNALMKKGAFARAVKSYQRAVLGNPTYLEAHNNLGMALHKLGDLDNACGSFKEALRINSEHLGAILNLSKTLAELGEFAEATKLAQTAKELAPSSEDAHNLLGIVYKKQGDRAEALESYKRALALNPSNPDTLANIGNLLSSNGQYLDSKKFYFEALKQRPEFPQALNNLGSALLELGDASGALDFYEKALTINQNSQEYLHNSAIAMLRLGRPLSAIKRYKKVIKLNPSHASALRLLTELDEFEITKPIISNLKKIWLTPETTPSDRCQIGFALYQSNKRAGHYKKAYRYLVEANAIQKRLTSYEQSLTNQRFKTWLAESEQWLENSPPKTEKQCNRPIFIVGMPRSGTTLVEQVISNHSKVRALGELPYAGKCMQEIRSANLPAGQKVRIFREQYNDKVAEHFGEVNIFTDKMPFNFQFLPMLAAAFPEARFIHVYRNPAAVCWSNFENYFRGMAMGFSNTLEDVVHFHSSYVSLLGSYSELLSDRVFHLSYEALTIDQYQQTQSLMQYLQLVFEESVLTPHLNDRAIATNSRAQVRRPMYTGSSEKWRIFKPYLSGAFDDLVPFAPAYPHETKLEDRDKN